MEDDHTLRRVVSAVRFRRFERERERRRLTAERALNAARRATICRRVGCCGVGLFARWAAGSGAFEGVSAIFEQGM